MAFNIDTHLAQFFRDKTDEELRGYYQGLKDTIRRHITRSYVSMVTGDDAGQINIHIGSAATLMRRFAYCEDEVKWRGLNLTTGQREPKRKPQQHVVNDIFQTAGAK